MALATGPTDEEELNDTLTSQKTYFFFLFVYGLLLPEL